MDDTFICPSCGGEIPPGAPEGMCPKCLLAQGMPDAVPDELKAGAGGEGEQRKVIGSYRLLEKIGEGGFGVVYLAQQNEPVKRRVALKIVKLGMDTGEVLARFEAERQALAMMDHPNIAQLFDGGATEKGRPYFVMELVRGVPITTYCDANKLPPHARIEIFRKVCGAVQHAHQKGIIHRDLKPSNILVTVQDDQPMPKVIDFGVAKALQVSLTERTLFTRYNQWIGTPAYMSPEQASLGSLDVDVRSDVYALGTILFELLTGNTPFSARELRREGYDAILRKIREEDPPKASTRLSSLTREEISKVADHRGQSPEKLGHAIKGEIDWILVKALERDRTRRYGSANDLALDLQRLTSGEPISAVPPTFAYRAGKVMRKHWKASSIAAAFVLVLMAAAITSAVMAVRATTAEGIAIESVGEARASERRALTAENVSARQRYNAHMMLARASWEDREPSRTLEILEGLRPGPGQPDFRGWEWYYMQSLFHQELHTIEFGDVPIAALAWSPDSGRFAAAGEGGTIGIWNAETGKLELEIIPQPESPSDPPTVFAALAWAPDGGRLVSGSQQGVISVWDPVNGSKTGELSDGTSKITALVFDPTGKRLISASIDSKVQVWDLATAIPSLLPGDAKEPVVELLIPPDGRSVIAVYYSGRLTAWQLNDAAKIYDVVMMPVFEEGGITSGALDPLGLKVFLCGTRSRMVVTDATTGVRLMDTRAHPDWTVTTIDVVPDGKHVCTSGSKMGIQIWEPTLQEIRTFYPANNEVVSKLRYSPDGRWLASASPKGTIVLWDAQRVQEASLVTKWTNWVGTVRWSPVDDRLAIDEMQPDVKVIDGIDGSELQKFGPLAGRSQVVAWSPDGKRIATGGYNQLVRIWDASSGKMLLELQTNFRNSFEAVWGPKGDRIAGLCAKTSEARVRNKDEWQMCIWNTHTGELLHRIHDVFTGAAHMDWSCDDLIAIPVKTGSEVDVYDASSGAKVMTLAPADKSPWSLRALAWSPDGQTLAAGGSDGRLFLFDISTQKTIVVEAAHTDRILDLAWTPDGTRLATAGWDKVVKIWNPKTRELVFKIRNPTTDPRLNKQMYTVSWNHNGTKLATGGWDKRVRVYDARKGYEFNRPTEDEP